MKSILRSHCTSPCTTSRKKVINISFFALDSQKTDETDVMLPDEQCDKKTKTIMITFQIRLKIVFSLCYACRCVTWKFYNTTVANNSFYVNYSVKMEENKMLNNQMTNKDTRPFFLAYDTRKMTKAEWYAVRSESIGGSECASVCALSKFRSPWQIFAEKKGLIKREKASSAAYFGGILEPVIRQEFGKLMNCSVKTLPYILKSKENDFISANIDGYFQMADGRYAILECKCTSAYNKSQWENGSVPLDYYMQCQHYLYVTGLEVAFLCCLIGGNELTHARIDRDENCIRQIVSMEKNFWCNHMLKNTPPPVSETDSEFLSALYPQARPETTIELPSEAINLIRKIEAAQNDIDIAKSAKEEAENLLKSMLKDCECGRINEFQVSWKNVTSKKLNQKAVKEHLSAQDLENCMQSITTRRFSISRIKSGK